MSEPTIELDPSNIIVGISDGPGLWVAESGAQAPSEDTDVDLDTWTAVGYISDDETPTVSQDISTEDITAWQTQGVLRRVLNSRIFSLGFTLIEVNPASMALWFDQAVPEATEGAFSITLSSTGAQNERAALLQVRDGEKLLRFWFPRAVLTEAGDVTFEKGGETGYPVKLTALDVDGSPGTFERVTVVA
jgi:hypothetical protein